MLSKAMADIRHALLQKDSQRFMEKTLRKPSLQLQDLNLFNSSLEDWEIKALNVKTAFLFGNLDEEDLSQTTRRFHQERHGEQSLSFKEGHL